MNSSMENHLMVTGGYQAFTITDGASRMLVVQPQYADNAEQRLFGYGIIQAMTSALIRKTTPTASSMAAFALALIPVGIALALSNGWDPHVLGLIVFGVVFAINSAIHSAVILACSEHDKVVLNVGFYSMANAGGRLTGTVISGWAYPRYGLGACLWWSFGFIQVAALLSLRLNSATTASWISVSRHIPGSQ